MPDHLRDVIGRMVAAGESEENIAAVIKQLSVQAPAAPKANAAEQLYDDFARANNSEPNPSRRAAFGRMSDGVTSGGVVTAAPAMAHEGLKIASGLARRLYSGLLKPSKAIRKEFGDVSEGLLNNRRLISKGGAEAAETAVEQSSKVANDMIANAPRPSPGVSARRVVQEFRPVRDAVKARVEAGVAPASEMGRIGARARRIQQTAKASGGRIDPEKAQTLKRTSQDAAAGAYRQMERGGSKMLGTDDLLDAATARGFKGGLEDIIPGIGKQNQHTQSLMGQSRALADAVGRTSNHLPFGSVSDLAAMGAGAHNPLLGVAGKLSTMAGPGSGIAIALNELGKRGLDKAAERAAMIAILKSKEQ